MTTPQQLLKTRISIVMRRENYTFLNTLPDYQVQLKKLFNFEYTYDEIEDALHQLEESFLITELDEQVSKDIPELPEDFYI